MTAPAEPSLNVIATAELLRQEADRRIEGRLEVLPTGTGVSCRAGCFACCHQLVVISPLEAHAIAAYLAEHPELSRPAEAGDEAWEARLAAHPELVAALDAFDAADGYLPGTAGGELELKYWRARLPCPFLADGLCTIYPVRPFACREHLVLSDPRLCDEDPDQATPAGTRLEFRAAAAWVGARVFSLPDRLLLLPRALEYAREHLTEAHREAPAAQVCQEAEAGQRRARLALARILFNR